MLNEVSLKGKRLQWTGTGVRTTGYWSSKGGEANGCSRRKMCKSRSNREVPLCYEQHERQQVDKGVLHASAWCPLMAGAMSAEANPGGNP